MHINRLKWCNLALNTHNIPGRTAEVLHDSEQIQNTQPTSQLPQTNTSTLEPSMPALGPFPRYNLRSTTLQKRQCVSGAQRSPHSEKGELPSIGQERPGFSGGVSWWTGDGPN